MSAELIRDTYDGHSWCDFYSFPDDPITIDRHTLNNLLRAEIVLQALMLEGVHNFENFEKAMNRAKEMLK